MVRSDVELVNLSDDETSGCRAQWFHATFPNENSCYASLDDCCRTRVGKRNVLHA